MNEVIINEKKYISSKQAAEITGYAKDYIGQLCREGRIPAQLIGRSWYVLESALQEHRFGAAHADTDTEVVGAAKEKETELSAWESPKYAVEESVNFPVLNRIISKEAATDPSLPQDHSPSMESINAAWKDWFARTEPPKDPIETDEVPAEPEESAQVIPIHALHKKVQEVVPENDPVGSLPEEAIVAKNSLNNEHAAFFDRFIRVGSLLAAILVTLVSIVGVGAVDSLKIQNTYVNYLSGNTYINQ